MADGTEPVRYAARPVRAARFDLLRHWQGLLAAALVLMLTFGTLVVVALRADGAAQLSPADWAAIRFTVLQASLSALISVALAVPVARALARRRFPGRGLLVTLLGAPFLLPVIVAILGLLAVFGQAGVVNALLDALGLPTVRIYGLHGVVLAHVFFNLPLATRLILQGWLAIPSERFRLAQSLGFSAADIQRHLEWPMLRGVLPGAFLVIFLICTTSFAVALTLGGGPRATTIELAIYQAFRFEFDLGKAALLGVVQFALGTTAALMAFAVSRHMNTSAGLDRGPIRFGGPSRVLVMVDAFAIAAVALFLLTPLTMVVLNGAPMLLHLPEQVFAALGRSLLVALLSTALTLALALSMSLFIVRARFGIGVEALAYLSISASPLVVGTGLFILLFPIADPIALALPVTALVNALMALPFAVRSLVPALSEIDANFGRLASSLGLRGLARFRLLVLPRIRRPLGFAAGLSAALSMGDLGVIALFADPNTATLPLQLYRLMGSYQMDEAAGAALLLLIAALALFWVFDRGGRVNADL